MLLEFPDKLSDSFQVSRPHGILTTGNRTEARFAFVQPRPKHGHDGLLFVSMSTSIDDGMNERQLGDWTDALDLVTRHANTIVEAFRGVDKLGLVFVGAAEIGWRYDDDRIAVVVVVGDVTLGVKMKDLDVLVSVVILFSSIV